MKVINRNSLEIQKRGWGTNKNEQNKSKVRCQCPWRCGRRPTVLRGQGHLNTKSILCFEHLWKYWLKSLNFTATATPLKFPFQKSMPGSRTDILLNHYQISDTREFELIKYSYVSSCVLHLCAGTSHTPLPLRSIPLNSTYYGIGTGRSIHVLFILPSLFSPSLSLPVQVSIRIFCFCIIY